MFENFTKADRKLIRKLGGIAWERELRAELIKLGETIAKMQAGEFTPFEADRAVHKFHNGITRDLYSRYSETVPWFAVCRARYDGTLTDDDIADASDLMLEGFKRFASTFTDWNGIESSTDPEEEE